jgi:hypothetical protein
MGIIASMLAVLVVLAAKLAAVRSKYFKDHVKDFHFPPMPMGGE